MKKILEVYNMNLESMKNKLLNKLVIHPEQKYVFYFKYQNYIIEEYHGNSIHEYSNFHIASITKQFTAYSIFILIEKKLLTLSTTLKEIYSNIPNYLKEITIEQLLTHQSGLLEYWNQISTSRIVDRDVIEYLFSHESIPLGQKDKFYYSNANYILLGNVIEVLSGMSYEEFLHHHVFEPNHLFHTFVNSEKIPDRVYGTTLVNDHFVLSDHSHSSDTQADGGIYSNLHDLKKWLKVIQTNPICQKCQVKQVLTHQPDVFYGYGFKIYDFGHIIYHGGSTMGFKASLGFSKELGIEFIFLTNCNHAESFQMIENIVSVFKGDVLKNESSNIKIS